MYKAAIIGAGNIGIRYDFKSNLEVGALTHFKSYIMNEKVEVVAICDSNEPGFDPGVNIYTNVDDLFTKEKLDIVSICTPTEFHFQHLKKCLDHNIPMIWLEKPVCSNLHESTKAHKTSLASKSTILVNYFRRYLTSFIELRRLISNKKFGNILSISIFYARGIKENGVHALDLLNFITEDKENFELVAKTTPHPGNVDCVLRTDNYSVLISGVKSKYHILDIKVTCESARLNIDNNNLDLKIERCVSNKTHAGFYKLAESEALASSNPEFALPNALEDLINSFESDKRPESNMDTAILTEKLLNNIIE